MIKRTLYFGNPAYLSLRYEQLVVQLPDPREQALVADKNTIPIEDIGLIVLDHPQITLTQALLAALVLEGIAVVSCDNNHMPVGMWLPLSGHTLQQVRFKAQIEASLPLKKQLWAQTVQAKIRNQAWLLGHTGKENARLIHMVNEVKSGDPDNKEAQAAAIYWRHFFIPTVENFTRNRDGGMPNILLNYGYAILRAIMARSLTASGLLPTLGIHHHNKYNAYCLADDIMEPYRPWVDQLVWQLAAKWQGQTELSQTLKREMLVLPVKDVWIDGERSPLAIAAQRTAASLVKCFEGKQKKVSYPYFKDVK